jgi:hypothetical protein
MSMRNRWFESISLQRGVRCELDFFDQRCARALGSRIYIFAGYNDTVVNPKVGDAVYRFYSHYLEGPDTPANTSIIE